MSRKLLVIATLTAIAAGAYAAAPLVAAVQIREAVHSGDVATLQSKVDWPSVRRSLKASLQVARGGLGEIALASGIGGPSLWQRVKASALPYLADPLIDRYVTAEGAPRLYAWRRTVGPSKAHGEAGEPSASAESRIERNLALVRRIERWSFVTPTRLELEIADRSTPERRWFAALEMSGLSWRLTEVQVKTVPVAAATAR